MGSVILDSVRKVFDDGGIEVVAVDDFGMEIEDGEFLVLVGPSGCGKTTTLRFIAGLETVTEGDILIDDQVVNDVKPKDRDIAMVFQNYALYPQKTVRENMGFGLRMTTSLSEEEITTKVEDVAEMLDITDLLDRKPNALSGGQQQRVALGRAVVREPEVFLMDEPLSNLDAKLRTEMRTELQQLQEKLETTTIYVTHDQTEAMTMGDRIAILNDGNLQQLGTPLDCYYEPENQFVAGFIGEPSMNFLSLSLESDTLAIGNGLEYEFTTEQVAAIEDATDGDLTLGIRPEDIQLAESPGPQVVEAQVKVVEPMGKENLLHLSLGTTSITASVSGEYVADGDEEVFLRFPTDRIHAFAPDGKSIFNRSREGAKLPNRNTF